MAEYVGIKVGKLHETTEMSEYYCARCGYPVTDHDSFCRECGGAFQRGPASEPCDRDALLALADEMETDGIDCYTVSTQYVLDDYARRIREALESGR